MADNNNPIQPPPILGGLPLGAAGMGANPIPPSNPISAGQTSPFDLSSIVSQVMNLQPYQQATQQLQNIQGQEQKVSQAQAGLQVPSQIYRPNYAPMTGQGFLGNMGGILGNIGKGALEGLSATGPGRAVYGNPRGREYEMQRQKLADQITGLKAQEEIPTEELRGLTGLAQAGGLAAYRGGELADRQARTAAYTQKVQGTLQAAFRNLDLKGIAVGNQTSVANARVALMNVMAQLAPEKLELQRYGIDADNATRMSVANVMSQLGIDRTHPAAQLFDQILGTSMTPPAPMTPGGAQPVQGQPPEPANPPKLQRKGANQPQQSGRRHINFTTP